MGTIHKMLSLLSAAGFRVIDATGFRRILGRQVTLDDRPPSWVKPGAKDPPGVITTNFPLVSPAPPVKKGRKTKGIYIDSLGRHIIRDPSNPITPSWAITTGDIPNVPRPGKPERKAKRLKVKQVKLKPVARSKIKPAGKETKKQKLKRLKKTAQTLKAKLGI